MDESEYWGLMEPRLCLEFDGIEACRRLGLWCDGLIPEGCALGLGSPSVTGRIWIGNGRRRQEPWRFELRLLGGATAREQILWQDQIPDDQSEGWLEINFESKFVLLDPAEARSQGTEPLRFGCPCCGYRTLRSRAGQGSFELCEICFWEDDPIQFRDWNFEGGANKPSLLQARRNFVAFGACDEHTRRNTRAPTKEDVRTAGWPKGS